MDPGDCIVGINSTALNGSSSMLMREVPPDAIGLRAGKLDVTTEGEPWVSEGDILVYGQWAERGFHRDRILFHSDLGKV